MSREIKFRDYNPETKEMNYFDIDHYDREVHNSYGNMTQYTGLKDKNGKEIYEGDIVKYFHAGYDELQIGEILFVNCSFVIVTKYWDKPNLLFKQKTLIALEPGFTIKVIGNIYEHPSLLELNRE